MNAHSLYEGKNFLLVVDGSVCEVTFSLSTLNVVQPLITSDHPKCKDLLATYRVYSLDGLLVLALLVVCTCAYITKVPRLKSFFLSEKKGFFGVFYKAAVIGIRLHWAVALSCFLMALYVLILK